MHIFNINLIASSAIPSCERLDTWDFDQLNNLCDVFYGQI